MSIMNKNEIWLENKLKSLVSPRCTELFYLVMPPRLELLQATNGLSQEWQDNFHTYVYLFRFLSPMPLGKLVWKVHALAFLTTFSVTFQKALWLNRALSTGRSFNVYSTSKPSIFTWFHRISFADLSSTHGTIINYWLWERTYPLPNNAENLTPTILHI